MNSLHNSCIPLEGAVLDENFWTRTLETTGQEPRKKTTFPQNWSLFLYLLSTGKDKEIAAKRRDWGLVEDLIAEDKNVRAEYEGEDYCTRKLDNQ